MCLWLHDLLLHTTKKPQGQLLSLCLGSGRLGPDERHDCLSWGTSSINSVDGSFKNGHEVIVLIGGWSGELHLFLEGSCQCCLA
jgi:hypothetical protein